MFGFSVESPSTELAIGRSLAILLAQKQDGTECLLTVGAPGSDVKTNNGIAEVFSLFEPLGLKEFEHLCSDFKTSR